ncbi:MAG: hypothetical protein NPIRA04_10680 [Nitrospirales bacterium]|nr:MAG: hypothetical protein NPIRA04_10680 [Nitrospirales bacterium]
MIPQLTEKEALSPVVLAFVDALKRSAFTGDVESHYGGRLSAATDNSIYQVTPQAVLFPARKRTSSVSSRLPLTMPLPT